MTGERAIVHIASTTPGVAMCGAEMPRGGVPVGPVDTCGECRPLFQEFRRARNK